LELTMNIILSLKQPLFYIVLPILIFLVFVGFPPPFAPPTRTKPAQEQSERADKHIKRNQS
jgi:hypothetical protein